MAVRFSSPGGEFSLIREQWYEAVLKIAQRGVFVGGAVVSRFESAFSAYCGAGHSVGVGNGTDALFLTLKALGIGAGDEVITAANTFIATLEAIHNTGARPVLVDCQPDTFLMDIGTVAGKISERTRAVIPVHLYGQMVDVNGLKAIVSGRGIEIVEDCAQAAGAVLGGVHAGCGARAGCFSFYPDKNLGALGDGGMIVTDSESLAEELRKLRNHGSHSLYDHEKPGFNSRLDPIQAAALELKLRHLDEWTRKRRTVVKWYESYLAGQTSVSLPVHRNDGSHVFHLYVIRVGEEHRDRLRKHLLKKGILTAIHYPVANHLAPAFSFLGYREGDFPVSERYARQIISLPIHIEIEEQDVVQIAEEIKSFFGSREGERN